MRLITLCVFVSVFASGPALCESIQSDYVYGNAEGCAFAGTGEFPETDAYVVVTTKGFHAHEMSCDFLLVLVGNYGDLLTSGICYGEGESWPESFVLTGLSDDRSFSVVGSDGEHVGGRLRECSGVTREQAKTVFGE